MSVRALGNSVTRWLKTVCLCVSVAILSGDRLPLRRAREVVRRRLRRSPATHRALDDAACVYCSGDGEEAGASPSEPDGLKLERIAVPFQVLDRGRSDQ